MNEQDMKMLNYSNIKYNYTTHIHTKNNILLSSNLLHMFTSIQNG